MKREIYALDKEVYNICEEIKDKDAQIYHKILKKLKCHIIHF